MYPIGAVDRRRGEILATRLPVGIHWQLINTFTHTYHQLFTKYEWEMLPSIGMPDIPILLGMPHIIHITKLYRCQNRNPNWCFQRFNRNHQIRILMTC